MSPGVDKDLLKLRSSFYIRNPLDALRLQQQQQRQLWGAHFHSLTVSRCPCLLVVICHHFTPKELVIAMPTYFANATPPLRTLQTDGKCSAMLGKSKYLFNLLEESHMPTGV